MLKKRIFLIVLDSLGAGAAPDADKFGDAGASTLGALSGSSLLKIDNLRALGLGNINGLEFLNSVESPKAVYGKLEELSLGKDTTIGHWELAGHVSKTPLPTFENGFPDELIREFSKKIGRGVICNKAYSGTQVILDYGIQHQKSGDLIVYTSADSVFQIAAHKDIIPVDELYDICLEARALLAGEYGVGRVIARPFDGEYPNYRRLPDRRDFSLEPPEMLLPEAVFRAGLSSVAIGKISDIFADKLFTRSTHTTSNSNGEDITLGMLKEDFCGLCFINLVDFDSKYGHRRDTVGYAKALNEFDVFLGRFISEMADDDLLMITADHGCDPSFEKSTDHTREYVPLLIYAHDIIPKDLGTLQGFGHVAATVAKMLDLKNTDYGESISLEFEGENGN